MPLPSWKIVAILLVAAALAVADLTINDSPRMLIVATVGLLVGGVVRFVNRRRRAPLADAGSDEALL